MRKRYKSFRNYRKNKIGEECIPLANAFFLEGLRSLLLTSKNGVGSEVGLVVGSIGLEHGLVDGTLVGGIDSDDGVGQDSVGVFNGLQATLSKVSAASITEFVGLVGTGGSTRRDTGGVGSGGGGDVDLDGRVSSGVNDFASIDSGDGRHHALGGNSSGGLAGDGAGELGQHGEDSNSFLNIGREKNGKFKLAAATGKTPDSGTKMMYFPSGFISDGFLFHLRASHPAKAGRWEHYV